MANHPPIDGSAAEAPPVGTAEALDWARPDRRESGTYALAPLGLDAMSFFSGHLGEFSRRDYDQKRGLSITFGRSDESDPRPMATLHLQPGSERADIEYRPCATFYALCGWSATRRLGFHIASPDRFRFHSTDNEVGDAAESAHMMRLSIPRREIEAITEVVRAHGGERVEPVQVDGAGFVHSLEKHGGVFVAYGREDDAPDKYFCMLFARDRGWLDATAEAIHAAVGGTGPGAPE